MINEINQVGLSRDFIIHPGETISEYLEMFNMPQKELAIRCDVSEKHVSTVISGQRNISVSFAKRLEYAFGIDADFWISLQSNYDKEIVEFEEKNNISTDELDVLKTLDDIKKDFIKKGYMSSGLSKDEELLCFRRILNVSNLLSIPKLEHFGAFRMQTKNENTNPYILFAWEKYCEMLDDQKINPNSLNIPKLLNKLEDIKRIAFSDSKEILRKLRDVFYSLGINFYLVKSYRGAPVQGYIRQNKNGGVSLYMTIRNKYADIFWFSLFHEIGHIVNGDCSSSFIDYESKEDEKEKNANTFAENALITFERYEHFIKQKDYSIESICNFSMENRIQPYMLIGRLMNDGVLKWNEYSDYRLKYKLSQD